MTTSLQRRIEALYGLERRKDKLGLDGTRVLLGALGDPHRQFRSVHVAGTNGKGSVCAAVERALREGGVRTGLYTSPHLVDFRERIRVGGRWVEESWLEAALDRIEALPEGRDRTFFEVATALGFLFFAERRVEIAVVEVGLGGRLDCTNVLAPEVTVITSISLDHTEILGDSLEAIAAEKAGILKPGIPAVLGVEDPAARAVVERIAREMGAPIVEAAGSGAAANDDVARQTLAMLRDRRFALTEEAIGRGLERARWPGRFEASPSEPRLWWDGAHNARAFERLVSLWLARHGAPPQAVALALSRDKDVAAILGALAPLSGARIVATKSRSERALDPVALAARARAAGFAVEVLPDVATAVRHALALGGGKVLLTGSLFAVGEAMELFGGAPGEML